MVYGLAWHGMVYGRFLFFFHIKCCVAVLAIMCLCVDELNWIFESISTVVGDCGNNSRLKANSTLRSFRIVSYLRLASHTMHTGQK